MNNNGFQGLRYQISLNCYAHTNMSIRHQTSTIICLKKKITQKNHHFTSAHSIFVIPWSHGHTLPIFIVTHAPGSPWRKTAAVLQDKLTTIKIRTHKIIQINLTQFVLPRHLRLLGNSQSVGRKITNSVYYCLWEENFVNMIAVNKIWLGCG